jgi:hypothetical protein
MKTALLALAIATAACSNFAQGIITFYNNNIPVDGRTVTPPAVLQGDGTIYRAGIFRIEGNRFVGAGAGYTAGLFLSSDLTTPLATTTFRLSNNFEVFAAPQDVAVPGVPVGSTATFVVRVWETAAGSFAAAANRGESSPWTSQPLGGPVPGNPPIPNATMSGFMGIIPLSPEPGSTSLLAVGLGAMLLRRRN